jgi:hypothetical protein
MASVTERRRNEEIRFRSFQPADTRIMTISDRVRQVIDDAAAEASARPLMENWGRHHSREEIISKIRVEVWHTPDGQALRDLDRAVGREPFTPATVGKIRKSKDGAYWV